MARPRKEIDKRQFENLCGLQCTLNEISSWFECSEDTIERWCKRTYKRSFAEVHTVYRGKGKISLRRAQFKLAEKNATMAIFLGKNYLGQKDQTDNSVQLGIETMKPLADLLEHPAENRDLAEIEEE